MPSDSRLPQLLALARELAQEASEIHRHYRHSKLLVDTKSSDSDFVSNVDREAEREIVQRLFVARPDDAVFAEEGGGRAGTSGVRWIIDPLDGTTNYVHGYPSFGCSIAVEIDGKPAIGVVTDSVSGAIYSGLAQGIATCDDRPISVRTPVPLGEALILTGFSYDATQRRQQGLVLARIIDRIGDIRRSGSAALDLCRLAAGAGDAFFELDLAPWDYAAGSIIARAAGADVVTLPAAHGDGPAVVAAHPALLPELIALLREAGALMS